MARNLVVCLDGTSNEPESGTTNVARTYAVAVKSESQLVYYDPGVGTMGARGAVTETGKKATRVAGLVVGFGVKDNIEEAYTWLSANYQRGDRIFVFGFSRGAYTARALTGMLRTVGLLRPGADNLTPYALKLYAQHGPENPTPEQETEFFRPRRLFNERFGNPDFPNPFNPHVHQVKFLGVWDTVKTIGWLNLKAQFEQARWPSTRRIVNVEQRPPRDGPGREAPALPGLPLRPGGRGRRPTARYVEQWFAGVHSDVGGQYDDHRALRHRVRLDGRRGGRGGARGRREGVQAARRASRSARPAPDDRPQGTVHDNGKVWSLLGGWKPRQVLPGDLRPPERAREDRRRRRTAPQAARLPGLNRLTPRRRTLPTWGTCDACPPLGRRGRGRRPSSSRARSRCGPGRRRTATSAPPTSSRSSRTTSDHPYSGYVETPGTLQLPVADRFTDVGDLFGEHHPDAGVVAVGRRLAGRQAARRPASRTWSTTRRARRGGATSRTTPT